MSLTFINHPHETFTPTSSGAIATIIWQCCRAASSSGLWPHVISRTQDSAAYDWTNTHFVSYPKPTSSRVANKLYRLSAASRGWKHSRQSTYVRRVHRVISQQGLDSTPLVVFNDPTWCQRLRRRFPKARIVHWFQNQQRWPEYWRNRFVGSADVVVACSGFTSRWIEDYYKLPPGSVGTVYNAVDANAFCPGPRQEGPPAKRPILNFVGRTHLNKGPDILLAAAELVAQRLGPVFDLQIVGSNFWDTYIEDGYQRQLRTVAERLQAAGVSVRFLGHVDRAGLPGVLREADIHVVPTRWEEPFGMTTIEGMACGLATIAAHGGGTPEIVDDAAVLFERGNVEALADGLVRLIEEPNERALLSRRGVKRARDFNWRQTWSDLLTAAAPGEGLPRLGDQAAC